MQPLITQQKDKLKNLDEKYNLKLVIFFGSRVEGAIHKTSDYDIAVLSRKPRELRNKFGEFINDCANAIGIPSDKADISLLDRANPLLLHEVSKNGILFYGTQYDFDNFNAYCYKQYIDYKPYFKLEEQAVDEFIKLYAK